MTLDFGTGTTGGPGVVDHVLVAAVTILLPIHDLLFWYPRLLRSDPGRRSRARSRAYLESAVIEWALFFAVLGWWAFRGRPFPAVGLGSPSGWGFWAAAVLALGAIVFATWQRLSLTRSRDDEVRRAVLAQLESLRPLLPHTRAEMRRFGLVSLTAGICEELLFRGLVLWYLASLIPPAAALLVGAALFGMAHAYQGTKGVLQTGLIGLGLVALYVVSGSLWVPMVLHAFVDVNSGLIAYAFLRPSPPSGTSPGVSGSSPASRVDTGGGVS
jgi:membrane protease YdiL (CAAX protease family)